MLYRVAQKKNHDRNLKTILPLNFFCLMILIICFIQTVVQVKITWSMHKKKSQISGSAKNAVSPSIQESRTQNIMPQNNTRTFTLHIVKLLNVCNSLGKKKFTITPKIHTEEEEERKKRKKKGGPDWEFSKQSSCWRRTC